MSRVDHSRRGRRNAVLLGLTPLWMAVAALLVVGAVALVQLPGKTPAASPSYDSPESRSSLFVAVMHQTATIPDGMTDRQLILHAYAFCDLARTVGVASAAGLTFSQAEDAGYPIGFINTLTTVGTNAFCPQHSEALDGYLLRPDTP